VCRTYNVRYRPLLVRVFKYNSRGPERYFNDVAIGGLSLLRRALDISNSTIVPPRKWPQVIVVLMCTRDVPGSNLC